MTWAKTWKTTHDDTVEVFRGSDGQYRWRVQAAGNNEIVGSGEGHPDARSAVAAAERHHPPVPSGE